MSQNNHNTEKRVRRHKKIRARISGTTTRPRLAVFRSNQYMYAQIIDDTQHITLAAANDLKMGTGTKVEHATEIGTTLAKSAIALGISSVVFDRGGFRFTGRIKALADAARAAGLNF